MQQITSLFGNPVFSNVLAIFLFILGVIVSILLVNKKKPKYYFETNNIISRTKIKYDNLAIHFKGKQIKSFSETKLYFWNSGSKSIRGTDLLKNDPLGIKADPSIDVYSVQYVTTEKLNKTFSIEREGGNLFYFNFDAIPKNQGFCVKLLHSDGDEPDSPIQLIGDIDGAKIKNAKTGKFLNFTKEDFQFLDILLVILSMLAIVLFIFVVLMGNMRIASFALGTIFAVFISISLSTYIRHFNLDRKPTIPSKLKKASNSPDKFLTLPEDSIPGSEPHPADIL